MEETKLICKKCGVITEGDYSFCPHCGTKYEIQAEKDSNKPKNKKVAPGNKVQEIYKKYKELHPESIVFIQAGYFYSVYFEDADKCCELFEWQLNPTAKNFSLTGCPSWIFPYTAEKLEEMKIPYILIEQIDEEGTIYREMTEKFDGSQKEKI